MLFSSISFLFYFLPLVLILYYLVPGRGKNYVLLLASLFFYAWGEPKYIFLMIATIILGYACGIGMERLEKRGKRQAKKGLLFLSLAVCLLLLGLFKYADFFIESLNQLAGMDLSLLRLALPIGISFYTFQLISYLVDVYRGNTPAQKNVLDLAVYITMFPQLIAGPIVRYVDVKEALSYRKISLEQVSYGIGRFCMGLGKKVLIANSLGELCTIYKAMAEPTILFSWIYAIAITLQIYFDFSGYSDMAIGLGSMLGFAFPENFQYPLTSKSATEFWRRWHITLGSWFRDYLYIPLGGNRVKPYQHLRNILLVWMATGFWHGANWNFIVWGIYFAFLLILEKYYLKDLLAGHELFAHIYCILAVMLSFIIFDHTVISEGLTRIGYLFGLGGIKWTSPASCFYLKDYGLLIMIAIVGATQYPKKCIQCLKEKGFAPYLNLAEPVFYALVFILATAFLVNGSFNPFLYFRF